MTKDPHFVALEKTYHGILSNDLEMRLGAEIEHLVEAAVSV